MIDKGKASRYLRSIARELKITDWSFVFDERPTDPGGDDEEIDAHTIYDDSRRVATVRVSSQFFKLTPFSQRRVLVHEVCHILARPADVVLAAVRKGLDDQAEKIVEELYHGACERITWAATYAVEAKLPFPRLKR